MIKIDKGIEVAAKAKRGVRPAKYPFKEMEVGDSFFVAKSAAPKEVSLRQHASKKLGVGCSAVRKITENGVEGFRVWRIK